jgi:transcriptional regulator with XRE-family HTH domain
MMVNPKKPTRVPALNRDITFGPDEHERGAVLRAFGLNLRALRREAGLSQEILAMRSFMRRHRVPKFETGERAPDLLALLVLANRLEIPVAALTDGLEAPVRRAGTGQVRDLIACQPGLNSSAVASALGLPDWYAQELLFYLRSIGAIVLRQQGWQPT